MKLSKYPCKYDFPNPLYCNNDDGLIGIGADLSPQTLRYAYAHGFFPWFNDGDPIMWWSPNPRCVIYPKDFIPSKTLKRRIKTAGWMFSINRVFSDVIAACADIRTYANETWINPAMIDAYTILNTKQVAYSVEIWDEDKLIGGLYGLKLGQTFFGESMFHRATDASKAAFFVLMQLCTVSKFEWVDCQLPNPHLMSLGATTVTRSDFLHNLQQAIALPSIDWSPICGQKLPLNRLLQDDFIAYQAHQLMVVT